MSLTGASMNSLSTSSDVDVDLTAGQLADIQGSGASMFYLTVSEDSATDMSGNYLQAVNHLMLGPVMQFATISLSTGAEQLVIIVSEVVDIASFDASGITLVNADGSDSYTLTDSSLTTAAVALGDRNILTIGLGLIDVRALKMRQTLCISAESCRVSLAANAISDRSGTPRSMVPIETDVAIEMQGYTADEAVPALSSVKIDMATNSIEFLFDEPIRADLVKMNQVTIQNTASSATALRKLVDTTYTGVNNRTIVAFLSTADMVYIKSNTALCYDSSSCYVAFLADTFMDTALVANSAPAITVSSARLIDDFVADDVSPTLVLGILDVNIGKLTLQFSEPVVLATFEPELMGIQKARNIPADGLILDASSTVTATDGHILEIALTTADLDFLLLDPELAIDRYTSYLTMTALAATDTANNPVIAIDNLQGKPVTTYVADETAPTLIDVQLDMNAATLSLVFSEYINYNSVDVPSIGIFNGTGAASTGYWLDGGSSLQNTANSKTLVIDLILADLNSLKDSTILATGTADTWVRVYASAVADLTGNLVEEISVFDVVQCTVYGADATPPALVAYTMDLDSGQFVLQFSETIDDSQITWSGIRLHEFAKSMYGTTHNFIAPVVTAGTEAMSHYLYVELSDADMASIKGKEIGISTDSIWLSMDEGAFVDMSGLKVVQILETGITGGASLPISSLIVDSSGPAIEKWRIDRDGTSDNVLRIWWSEPVSVSTLAGRNPLTLSNSTLKRLDFQLGENVTAGNYGVPYTLAGDDRIMTIVLTQTLEGMSGSVWDELVKMNIMNVAEGNKIRLSSQENIVTDLAPAKNGNGVQEYIAENTPTCGCSSAEQYVKTRCTSIDDAVCTSCTVCSAKGEYYESKSCETYLDTECTACFMCDNGYYPAITCPRDPVHFKTDCALCTECDDMSYETAACTGGNNRICASCKVCVWLNDKQEMACNSKQKTWRNENCCWDKNGNQIKCKSVDYANLEIEAKNGRHHWVFPDTTPAIEGFGIYEWSGD
jgi:hypothetical protein